MDEEQFVAPGSLEEVSMISKEFIEKIPMPIRKQLSLNEGDTVAMYVEQMPIDPRVCDGDVIAQSLVIRKVNRVGTEINADQYHMLSELAQGDKDAIELLICQAIKNFLEQK